MVKPKLTAVGSSTGVVASKEFAAGFDIEKGDGYHLSDLPDGSRATAYQPEFAEQMELAHCLMRERRNVLRELAK